MKTHTYVYIVLDISGLFSSAAFDGAHSNFSCHLLTHGSLPGNFIVGRAGCKTQIILIKITEYKPTVECNKK